MLGIACGFMCYPVVDVGMNLLEGWYPEVWAGLSPAVQNIEPRVETWSVVAAFGISVGVGILFGVFPARQAAQLDPIEALRHE
ncbi:MAG: hypothetical protein MK004_22700, partial [Planctomycetales bacterium]|nr:hypothetical protein [Planctomycetales bacterium]